jgi:hypothetical protein
MGQNLGKKRCIRRKFLTCSGRGKNLRSEERGKIWFPERYVDPVTLSGVSISVRKPPPPPRYYFPLPWHKQTVLSGLFGFMCSSFAFFLPYLQFPPYLLSFVLFLAHFPLFSFPPFHILPQITPADISLPPGRWVYFQYTHPWTFSAWTLLKLL